MSTEPHPDDELAEYETAAERLSPTEALEVEMTDLHVDVVAQHRYDDIGRPAAEEGLRAWRQETHADPLPEINLDDAVRAVEHGKAQHDP